jgi:UPF0755 protein
MTRDGRHWTRSGRRRRERDDYRGEEDYGDHRGQNGHDAAYPDADGYVQRPGYDSADSHGWPGEYGHASGYGGADRYGSPEGYGDQASYADPRRYADQPEFGDPNGYGDRNGYQDPNGYGDRNGYGGQAGYGEPGGYGAQAGYGEPGGYGAQTGYSGPSGHPGPGGYGDHRGYGEAGYAESGYDQTGYGDPGGYATGPGGRGRHSAGSAAGLPDPAGPVEGDDSGYAPDVDTNPYGPGSYGSADRYGPGTPGSYGSSGEYGRRSLAGPPDAGAGHEQDPASGYQWQGPYGAADPLGPASYDTGSYPAGSAPGYDTGSIGRADTGSHGGWAFTPGGRGYDSDPLAQGAESLSGSPADGFGQDSGTFGRPDTGSFGRPETGSFGRGDSGTFDRPDTASSGRGDSGAFGRPDISSFGRDEDYEGEHDPGQDTGSIRWTSGPPAVKLRADRDGEDPAFPARRALPAAVGGYADWRDDPVDDDWEDDADGGLLSRRFGRRGGGGEPGERGRGRARKPRRLRGKAAFLAAILVVALVVGVAAAFGYKYVNGWITNRYGDYKGEGTGNVEITVNEGATLAGLGPLLLRKGVIMSLRPYDTAAAAAQGTLQPGVYGLHRHMNSAIAVSYLLKSKYRVEVRVTITEGTRASAIAAQLAKSTGRKESDFLQLINHPASLGLPSWAAGKTAEGFLFPDTYSFLPGESPLKILQTMVSEFNSKAASMNLASEAKKVHTNAWHVLIVASMAQAESGPDDFGKVARVAWNRLGQGMALHFDSTVFYGLGVRGNQDGAAKSAQIKKDTPYNTYIHPGLPPGPIGNPSLAALQAAVDPPHGPWLYFITDLRTKPSQTHFTASYSQFQKWQQQFQG